jgi:DNA replication protein DnaC
LFTRSRQIYFSDSLHPDTCTAREFFAKVCIGLQGKVYIAEYGTRMEEDDVAGKVILVFPSPEEDEGRSPENLCLHNHFCQGHYYEKASIVRWLPCLNMDTVRHCKKDGDGSLLMSVFSPVMLDNVYEELHQKMTGQHENVRCGIHEVPLNLVTRMKDFLCSVTNCNNLVSARCLSNNHIIACTVGVCLKHWKSFSSDGKNVYHPMKDNRNMLQPQIDGEVVPTPFDHRDSDQLDESLEPLGGEDFDLTVFNMACAGNQEMTIGEASMLARCDTVPIFDINRRLMAGHFYLNDSLNVLKTRFERTSTRPHPVLSAIVNSLPGHSECLLFPEALLFPTLFWDFNEELCTFPGALPSYFFYEGGAFHSQNFGDLRDHMDIRLRDHLCLTSRTPAYHHFWFDVLTNNALSHTSANFIQERGFEFVPQLREKAQTTECLYSFDEETSSKKKKELSYLIREGKWDYFVTLTANDAFSPGLCKIYDALKAIAGQDDRKMLMLDQEYQALKLKSWRRTVHILMKYFLESPDHILGNIKTYFLRWEFQSAGSIGNKPHVHMGLTLHDEPEEATLDRICNKTKELFSECFQTDEVSLSRNGLIDEQFTYNDILPLSKLQQHSCEMGNGRCMRRDGEGNERCRVPLHPQSDKNWFEELEPFKMDEDLARILEDLGLCEIVEGEVVYDEKLRAGRWHYKSDGVTDHAVPTIPALLAIFKSTTNVQHCDPRFQVAYLIKYITKQENHAFVYNKNQKSQENVALETDTVRNMTYHSEKVAQKLQDKKKAPIGREICYQEVLWNLFGFEYSLTNVHFVHVSTFPPEFRGGVLRHNSRGKTDNTEAMNINDGRLSLPEWRRFTDMQIIIHDSYRKSKFTVDNTSQFNIRPPELFVFSDLFKYFKWFAREKQRPHKKPRPGELKDTLWLDALGFQWKVRSQYVRDAANYLESLGEGNDAALALLEHIFQPLMEEEDAMLCVNFVNDTNRKPVVVVGSLIDPLSPSQFLYHLCLAFGKVTTELEFCTQGSALECLRSVGIFQDDLSVEENLRQLFRRYVQTDLLFHPCNIQQLGKKLKASDAFFKLVQAKDFDIGYLVFDNEMTEKSKEDLNNFWSTNRNNVIEAAMSMSIAFPDPPSADWKPILEQTPTQSRASFEEQRKGLDLCLKAVDAYHNKADTLRFPILTGPPGTGKTHIMFHAALYAVSLGYNVMMTSITGERARVLGGMHFHLLLGMAGTTSHFTSVQYQIKSCVQSLYQHPMKLAKLVQTDIFFIDEIGMFNSEQFSIFDKVLQLIMNSRKPFGGKLVLASGDCLQLPPINGHSLWLSTYLLTCFQLYALKEYVRAEGDANLRLILKMFRKSEITNEEVELVWQLIESNCRFVSSWDEVPDMALRIVATKKARKKATNNFLHNLESRDVVLVKFQALDEYENNNNHWYPADASFGPQISKDCLEEQVLTLYQNAVVRMTYNSNVSGIRFNQGQLAIVYQMPDSSVPVKDQRLGLILVPPGCTTWDEPSDIWQKIIVPLHTTPPIQSGYSKLRFRRQQWPVVLNISCTVHKIIGSTCNCVATELNQNDASLRFWEREQFVVLVSRVRKLSDLYFVGNPDVTHSSIQYLCQLRDMWRDYVNDVVYKSAVNIVQDDAIHTSPFLPFYRELPNGECVYIIYSASSGRCYCGQTEDMRRRINQHNTGNGAAATREGRPWDCLALVTGITNGERERRDIESQVHGFIHQFPSCRPFRLLGYMRQVVQERNAASGLETLKYTAFHENIRM